MHESELIEAVVGNLHDDAPRLAYADWLQGNNLLDRAEFIRLQCEIAAMNLPFHHEKSRKADHLLFVHWEEWTAPLTALGMLTQIHFMPDDSYARFVGFRRGFVEELILTAEHFVLLADKFFEAAPMMQSLALRNTLESLWQRAEGFDPKSGFQDSTPLMRRFALLIARVHLTHLDLSTFALTPGGLEYLCDSPLTSDLTHLELWQNQLGDEGALVIAQCERWWQLQYISLDRNEIADKGANALADFTGFPDLIRLTLTGNDISEAGISRLRTRFGDRVEI